MKDREKRMKNLILVFILIIVSLRSYSENSQGPGQLVPVSEINQRLITAMLKSTKEWCTPAVLIGPRTFITAAHCTFLVPSNGMLKVVGPSISQFIHVQVISTPAVTDDDFFLGTGCEKTINGISQGTTLSPQQLLTCWFAGGKPDIALLVADSDISGPMLSLSSNPVQVGEPLKLLGESPKCGGDDGFYHIARMDLFGFSNSQMVLDTNNTKEHACGGDSGGIYFRKLQNNSVSVVGLHSADIRFIGPFKAYNKSFYLPPNFSGGTNITDPKVMRWLVQNIESYDLKICGINVDCPELKF